MKAVLLILLLIGVAGVAVMGSGVMSHASSGGSHAPCVLGSAQGVECSPSKDGFGLAVAHLDAFKGFSTAVVSEVVSLSLLFALALLFIFSGILWSHVSAFARVQLYPPERGIVPLPQSGRIHWLAIHEHSPTRFFGTVMTSF
ncbi:MAG: hypothetical protein HY460_01640 [Parcubacteria group bacterium]|nr:hypothetical protein [Parcubacteria group bacterium]